ncbi:hypothetical protein HYH03_018518 [Edaphochlamys debaryana]|uniref:Uncharacterized protein n=1 Tax=Edaphochlamys debaryana TaxID=47281 RepID=A0A836BPB3_9CHLO|nr:hypothetical protein HYH03_018518 [Edaphochlamys debaryana]|eukprot:KAG2482559.1 hypothetical protein HYH03_018518 [Edaphochlamys debaryana]
MLALALPGWQITRYCTSSGGTCRACDATYFSFDPCATADDLGADSAVCRLPAAEGGSVASSSMCGGRYVATALSGSVNGTLLAWREGGGQTLAVTLRLSCDRMLPPGSVLNVTARYGSGLSKTVTWSNTSTKATCISVQMSLTGVDASGCSTQVVNVTAAFTAQPYYLANIVLVGFTCVADTTQPYTSQSTSAIAAPAPTSKPAAPKPSAALTRALSAAFKPGAPQPATALPPALSTTYTPAPQPSAALSPSVFASEPGAPEPSAALSPSVSASKPGAPKPATALAPALSTT